MKLYNYYYFILEKMHELSLTNTEVNLLFFLRYFAETNQETDMDKIAENLKIDIMQVASMIEKLMNDEIICLSKNNAFQYDTNIIFKTIEKKTQSQQSEIFEKFETGFGRTISQKDVEKINELIQMYPQKLVEYALREAVLHSAKNINYVEKVLMNWKKRNMTVEEYEANN